MSLQHTQQPAGLSLEPRRGKEQSHRIRLEDSACALCLLEEKGGSQQHDDLSTHPVPSRQLCPPRPANQCRSMPSLLYCPFLAMGSGQGPSRQLCLGSGAPHPAPVSFKPHSLGSYASLPFPPSPVLRCPVPIPCHLPLGAILLYSSKGAVPLPSHLLPGIRACLCCHVTSQTSSSGANGP